MLKNNFIYQDEYMFFTFNNIHSSRYNLFIQNGLEDLKLHSGTNSKVSFIQPQYQTGQYMLGVNSPQRSFKLKLAGHNLHKRDIIEICKWLRVGTIGTLSFDFAYDWCYDTVVTQCGEPNLYVQSPDVYTINIEVEWNTLQNPYAHTRYNAYYILDNTSKSLNESSFSDAHYASVFNTDLLIPALTLYEKDNNNYNFRINFLGDSIAYFNFDFQYNPFTYTEAKVNKLSYIKNTEISFTKQTYDLFYTQLKAEINDSLKSVTHTIQYLGLSNLFVADNQLPEQAYYGSHFKNLQVQYNNTPLVFKSPGAPIRIESVKHFEQLKITNYKWFVCKKGAKAGSSSYPYIPPEGVNYPYPYAVTGCTLIYDDEFSTGNFTGDFINDTWYFGFYEDFTLKHDFQYSNPSYEDFQGTLTVQQYMEVI